jgi:hypothetical protein
MTGFEIVALGVFYVLQLIAAAACCSTDADSFFAVNRLRKHNSLRTAIVSGDTRNSAVRTFFPHWKRKNRKVA